MSKTKRHPGVVNSSQLVIGVLVLFLITFGMAEPFEEFSRSIAFSAVFAYGMLYTISFALMWQFNDTAKLMFHLVFFLLVLPVVIGLVLNFIFGELQTTNVPYLYGYGGILNVYAGEAVAMPSVFLMYGSFASASALLISFMLEFIYVKLIAPMVPKRLTKLLLDIDKKVDMFGSRNSDNIFLIGGRGLLISLLIASMQILALIAILSFA